MAKVKATRRARTPVFGKDYDRGWVGFAHSTSSLSRGIAYLTRREKTGDVVVSHSFLVTGPDECVEANLPVGVVKTSLRDAYFDKGVVVHFRKPRGLTPTIARRLVKTARAQVGAGFDFGLFVAEGLGGTFVGHLFNSFFSGKPHELMTSLLNQKDRWICSELVAYCLRSEPAFRGKGVLAHPPATVSPQGLYEDDELFEDCVPGRRRRKTVR
jgi:hypothetical protein